MSFVLVRDRSRLGHKPDYRHGWSPEYVRKSMYACRSVSVACRPAEKRRRRGEIGSIHRSILVGHRRPNRPQGVNDRWVIFDPRELSELTYELARYRRVAGASRLACTQQTLWHASIFSHTHMITRAAVWFMSKVENDCDRTGKDICGPTDNFQQFWNGYGR